MPVDTEKQHKTVQTP